MKLKWGYQVVIFLLCLTLLVGYSDVQQKEELYTKRTHDLARVWKTASDMYGYWDQIGGSEKWDKDFQRYLAQLRDYKDHYDYYMLLEEMIAGLQDGHAMLLTHTRGKEWATPLHPIEEEQASQTPTDFFGYLPISLTYIDGKYVVNGRRNETSVPLYAVITHINGEVVDQYIEQNIGKLVGITTDVARQEAMAVRLYKGSKNDTIRLTYVDTNGKTTTEKLKYNPRADSRLIYAQLNTKGERIYQSNYHEVYLIDSVAHIKIKTLDSSEVVSEFYETVVPLIEDAEGYVIDLRYCSGGDTSKGTQIIDAFTKKPISSVLTSFQFKSGLESRVAWQTLSVYEGVQEFKDTEIFKRGVKMLNSSYYVSEIKPDAYSQKIIDHIYTEVDTYYQSQNLPYSAQKGRLEKPCVMLISSYCASAGESTAILAQDAGIPLIGTHTRGLMGGVVCDQLSNGWIFGISAANSYGPNGEVIWNNGVKPNIEVKITYENFAEGNDVQLDAALEHLNLQG